MPGEEPEQATTAVARVADDAKREAVVCIPTYNERQNLPSIVRELLGVAPVDILIIDDNSPDGTGAVADGLVRETLENTGESRVHVLHRPGKQGLGKAYLAGFRWALERHYQYIFEMDADFSHQPRYVPEFLRAIQDHDLVLGSRYVEGGGTENWSRMRQVISRGGSLYARSILGLGVRDLTGGFKCFRREVLEALDLESVECTGYAFQIELTYRAIQQGFRVKEIPIVFYEREAGSSKMSRRIVVEAMTRVPLMRFRGG